MNIAQYFFMDDSPLELSLISNDRTFGWLYNPMTEHLFRCSCMVIYMPGTGRVCGGCHREIGYSNYLGCMGTFFHPECFRCHSCGHPITENEVVFSSVCYMPLIFPKWWEYIAKSICTIKFMFYEQVSNSI